MRQRRPSRAPRAGSAARRWRSWPVALVALGAAGALVAGCADFTSQAAPNNWTPAPVLSPEQPPNPMVPGQPTTQQVNPVQPQTQASVPPPQGCQDFNPAVIATCLDIVSAVAALPGTDTNPVALAAERTTGRVLRVQKNQQPAVVTTLPVVATGDGGLTGLALSPSYTQDQLVFAYVTTPTDNRVVRIAPGDTPKPVLTGIPKGPTDNRGVLAVDHKGALLVATGDAGNPALAADPSSLAGKVLRIDVNGSPATGDPTPGSAVVASGLTDPGGVCSSTDGSRAWVTDRTPTRDVLYRLQVGQALSDPAWTWPDRPGVAGCVSFPTTVMVATSVAGNVQSLALNADGSFTGRPQVSLQGARGFGRLSGLDGLSDKLAVGGTVNRDGGTPASSDDRVVVIQGGAAGGGQD